MSFSEESGDSQESDDESLKSVCLHRFLHSSLGHLHFQLKACVCDSGVQLLSLAAVLLQGKVVHMYKNNKIGPPKSLSPQHPSSS